MLISKASKFPKSARILSRRHFQAVLKRGKKFIGTLVIIDYRLGKSPKAKLGLTVSKRYGKAHLRNRFKRVIREAFRSFYQELPQDIEMNVIPRLPLQKINREKVLADFVQFALTLDVKTIPQPQS